MKSKHWEIEWPDALGWIANGVWREDAQVGRGSALDTSFCLRACCGTVLEAEKEKKDNILIGQAFSVLS